MKITASGTGLIGRKKELKLLLEHLKNGQHAALIAPRRFGKSALVSQALKQMKAEGYYITHMNFFAAPTADLLSSGLTKEVLRNLKLHKAFQQFRKGDPGHELPEGFQRLTENFPGLSSFSKPMKDEWLMLAESLNFPEAFASRQGKRMICAYEDLEILRKVDQSGRISALLHHQLKNHVHTSYMFTGPHPSVMQDMLFNGTPPMVNQEHIIHLGYINNQVLIDSLKKKFSGLKLKLPRHYLKDLVKFTKGHPYYTQLAIRHIILSYVLEGKVPGSKELPAQLLRLEKDYLEKIWEDISGNSEYVQVLLALPSGSTNIYPRLKRTKINVARAQKKLEEMGLLFKNNLSGYSIADPLLELWIKQKL